MGRVRKTTAARTATSSDAHGRPDHVDDRREKLLSVDAPRLGHFLDGAIARVLEKRIGVRSIADTSRLLDAQACNQPNPPGILLVLHQAFSQVRYVLKHDERDFPLGIPVARQVTLRTGNNWSHRDA